MRAPLLGAVALPTTVTVGGVEYAIASDFRIGIRFEEMVADPGIPDSVKLVKALDMYYGDAWRGTDISGLIESMLDFYRCGKPALDDETSTRPYSFAYDYDLIFAAFLQTYGIDLLAVEGMHWWRFRAMLAALPRDCQFCAVVGVRTARITRDMSPEQRKELRRLKRIWALPSRDAPAAVKLKTQDEVTAAVRAVVAAKRGELT